MATIEERVAECEQRGKSNTHRIDKIEEDQEALGKLATSVAVMAEQQRHTTESVDRLGGDVKCVARKVDALEKAPAKRWEFVVEKSIYIIVAAVLGYVLARFGLAG